MLESFADRFAAFAVLGAAFLATSVAAAPRGATEAARAGSPVPAVIIDGRVWSCTDTACRASASGGSDSQPATRECARAAAALGPFTAYATGERVLTAAELTRCNARAPAPAALLAAR